MNTACLKKEDLNMLNLPGLRKESASEHRHSMKEKSMHRACSSPTFAPEEMSLLRTHMKKATACVGYGYDMERILFTGWHEHRQVGVVWLRSRKFGYDFALRAGTRSGSHFGSRRPVDIYISLLGKGDYEFLETAHDVLAALRSIDKRYQAAARKHLPL